MSLMRCYDVNIHLQDNKSICQHLDLEIKTGEVWGVLGRNGSGKTTLLHTLAGLHKHHSGYISLNQQPLEKLSHQQIAQQLAVLFQDSHDSFPCSVLDSVLIGRHPHIKPWNWESHDDHLIAHDALKALDLLEFKHRMINTLSGGERRRVAIASVLCQTPNLFLLDEPLNHLDLKHQIQILKYFHQLSHTENKATLMSLHDINVAARYCDHLILLYGDGKYKTGATKELLNKQILQDLYQQHLECIASPQGDVWVAV